MDLTELGGLLRERRETLGIPRAVLGRRIGASTSYVWMIEGAKKRAGGNPAQPSRALLERWARALGWEGTAYVRQLLALAGHLDENPAPPLLLAANSLSYANPKAMEKRRLITELEELLDAAEASEENWRETVRTISLIFDWQRYCLGLGNEQAKPSESPALPQQLPADGE